jgi:hypothetical protein
MKNLRYLRTQEDSLFAGEPAADAFLTSVYSRSGLQGRLPAGYRLSGFRSQGFLWPGFAV